MIAHVLSHVTSHALPISAWHELTLLLPPTWRVRPRTYISYHPIFWCLDGRLIIYAEIRRVCCRTSESWNDRCGSLRQRLKTRQFDFNSVQFTPSEGFLVHQLQLSPDYCRSLISSSCQTFIVQFHQIFVVSLMWMKMKIPQSSASSRIFLQTAVPVFIVSLPSNFKSSSSHEF